MIIVKFKEDYFSIDLMESFDLFTAYNPKTKQYFAMNFKKMTKRKIGNELVRAFKELQEGEK